MNEPVRFQVITTLSIFGFVVNPKNISESLTVVAVNNEGFAGSEYLP